MVLCLLAAQPWIARAESVSCDVPESVRGLVSPRADAPAQIARGEALVVTLASATGLTPPPGLQEPRAHRALYVGLCSEGVARSAPARVCTPLRIDDVRPCAAHSLVYRVRAHVEAWLAEGDYTLRVRFPGGEAELREGVRIGSPRGVRVHVGGAGVSALPAGADIAPLPAREGGFGAGFVLQTASDVAELAVRPPGPALSVTVHADPAHTMGRVHVRVLGAPANARVFVRSGLGASAFGSDTWLPAGVLGPLSIAALVVGPDGRTGFATTSAEVLPKLAFGCAVTGALGEGATLPPAVGLLVLALSATLRRLVRQKRRDRLRNSLATRGNTARTTLFPEDHDARHTAPRPIAARSIGSRCHGLHA